MKREVFVVAALFLLVGCKTTVTDVQRQDAANALACVSEARDLVLRNAPVSASLIASGVPEGAAIMPQDASDWATAGKLLGLAETSLWSINEEFRVRPLQHETGKMLVSKRDYNELASIASKAKLQAGRMLADKYAIGLFGVTILGLTGGLLIFGVMAYLRSKNPVLAEAFKKFVGAFQITRTETPIEIAQEISKRFEGVDPVAAAEIVKNAMDNSLRAKLPKDCQEEIAKLKEKLGIKV